MKVLFIYTDVGVAVGYSCGIGVLSAYLKRAGHETALIHVAEELGYPFDAERIARGALAVAPDLVALSPVTNQWAFARGAARALRARSDVPIVAGGHHPTSAPIEVLAEPAIDVVVRGEGEGPLLALVERLERGEPIDDVPNLAFRADCRFLARAAAAPPGGEGAGEEIVQNPLERWVDDLDTLPFEDRDLFDYDRIVEARHGWAEVIASRGCPYTCSYCFNLPFFERYRDDLAAGPDPAAVTLRDFVRRRSVDSTIAMLREVRDRHPGVRFFTFVDDVFAIHSRWLEELAPRYRAEIGLPFAATSQPLAFNARIAALLAEMGCKVVKMGVESGTERIRNLVLDRPIRDEVLVRDFALARAHDLKPQAFNMLGLPGETAAEMHETVRFNARLRPYVVWVSTFMPFPGSPLYDHCREHDLVDDDRWESVDGYRGESVLRETSFTYPELARTRVLFRWHLNAALGNGCSDVYARHARELEGWSDDRFLDGSVEAEFRQRDGELDDRFRAEGVDHYVGKGYLNLFWAAEYGHDLS